MVAGYFSKIYMERRLTLEAIYFKQAAFKLSMNSVSSS